MCFVCVGVFLWHVLYLHSLVCMCADWSICLHMHARMCTRVWVHAFVCVYVGGVGVFVWPHGVHR